MKWRQSTTISLGLLIISSSACTRSEDVPHRVQEEHPESETSADTAMRTTPDSTDGRHSAVPAPGPGNTTTDRAAANAASPEAAGPERLTGRVVVTGSQPMTFTTLQMGEGRSVNLTGPLEAELRRLSGGVVTVMGVPSGRMPGGSFEVRDYEVTSIDGQRPEVGELSIRDGGVWLVGLDTVRLSPPVPDELRSRPGAKVWIIGIRSEDALRVQSYGVIRGR
jgi:hypothetical protein